MCDFVYPYLLSYCRTDWHLRSAKLAVRAMDGMAQQCPQLSDFSKSRYGGRENNVTISVVKNVVFNMESVLCDLKGIMGEITTIVDHIDTVTGRIDKHSNGGKNTRNLHSTNKDVGKSLFGKHSESKLVKIDTDVAIEAGNKSAAVPSQLPPFNKVLKVIGFSQHRDFISSKQQKKHAVANIDGANRLEWKNTSKMLCLSKEMNHIDKNATGIMPHNGAIAIVHPTIFNSLPAESSSGNTETSDILQPTVSIKNFPAMSSKQSNMTSRIQKSVACMDNNSQWQVFIDRSSLQKNPNSKRDLSSRLKTKYEMATQDIEEETSKQEKEEQEHITFNMHMDIVPITQTDQKSSLTGAKEKQHPHSQLSRKVCTNLEAVSENFETSTAIEPVQLHSKCSRDTKTQVNSILCHTSDPWTTSTGEVDLLKTRSRPCQNQDLMFKSPLTRRSSPKSVYHKVQHSPASIRSMNINRGCEAKSYYCSTESDADSDSCVEYHDVRSLTPDIDWSYLNLVGNGDNQHSIAIGADTKNKICAVSEGDMCKPHSVYSRQKNATVEAITEELDTPSLLEAKAKFDNMPSVRVHRYSITGNPVPIHIFCSEVSSFESVGYCGYYEAILDSVLENIAGFESFEEACDVIEDIGTLNEAYTSCDTEFEEDDWDIGLKSGHQDSYSLPRSHGKQHEGLHLESSEFLDGNRNVLTANSSNPNMNFESDYLNININTDWPRPSGPIDESLFKEKSKGTSYPTADYENQDSFKCSAADNSLIDSNNGAIIQSSNLNQNLIFRQGSIHSTELSVNNKQAITAGTSDGDTDRSINDAASCPSDGSPMSFSSSQMAYPSPETDHVESVSEDDSLSSSQEDSLSLSSESGYDSKMFIHKAKIKRLRREFFLSLYRKFDDTETEPIDNNRSVTSLDDISSLRQSLTRLENNRDSVSESESYMDNVTGYNKSINTWKEYALVDLQNDDMSDSASYVFYENNDN